MSKIEKNVSKKILGRSKIGEKKYGVTMERTDLNTLDWLVHAQEEAMDMCVYLEKLIDTHQNTPEYIDYNGYKVFICKDALTDEEMIKYLEEQGHLDVEELWEDLADLEGFIFHNNLWLKDNPSTRLNGKLIDWDWIIKNDSDIPALIEEVKVMIKNL